MLFSLLGRVTGLAVDTCFTIGPGIPSSIPACSHTFIEIDHEIISVVMKHPCQPSGMMKVNN